MPVSCCQGSRGPVRFRISEPLGHRSLFMSSARNMNRRASCWQMLLARMRYKKFSALSLAGNSQTHRARKQQLAASSSRRRQLPVEATR